MTAPLRQARRATPAGPLRDQIAAVELAAELDQLEQLGATVPEAGSEPPAYTAEKFAVAAGRLLIERGDRQHAAALLRQLASSV